MALILLFLSFAHAACDWKSSHYGSFSGDSLPEASGMTSDGTNLYFINDTEGDGAIYLYSQDGALVRKNVSWSPRNLEAIGRGNCGDEQCLFLADIGDNDRDREIVSVLAVQEGSFQKVQEWKFRYEDGPQNVEAFFVAKNGDFYFLSKAEKKKAKAEAKLYRLSAYENSGIAKKIGATIFDAPVTDMAASPDQKTVAVLSTKGGFQFPFASFVNGNFSEGKPLPMESLPKQESITYLREETILWSSEAKKLDSVPILRIDCGLSFRQK